MANRLQYFILSWSLYFQGMRSKSDLDRHYAKVVGLTALIFILFLIFINHI
jgi:hypothetical protein